MCQMSAFVPKEFFYQTLFILNGIVISIKDKDYIKHHYENIAILHNIDKDLFTKIFNARSDSSKHIWFNLDTKKSKETVSETVSLIYIFWKIFTMAINNIETIEEFCFVLEDEMNEKVQNGSLAENSYKEIIESQSHYYKIVKETKDQIAAFTNIDLSESPCPDFTTVTLNEEQIEFIWEIP
jgi:hypothetical protein